MNPNDLVKEITERTSPVAKLNGCPVFVNKGVPEWEVLFMNLRAALNKARKEMSQQLDAGGPFTMNELLEKAFDDPTTYGGLCDE